MDPFTIAVLAVGGAAAAGARFALSYFRRHEQGVREIREIKRSRLERAKLGNLHRFVGTAERAGELEIAPLTGRPCIAWKLVVWEECLGVGDATTDWRRLLDSCGGTSFVLREAHSSAFVEVAPDSLLTIVLDVNQRPALLAEPTKYELEVYRRMGMSATSVWGPEHRIHFQEGVLEPGEKVAVAGVLRRERDPSPSGVQGYRGHATRFVLSGPPGDVLRVSDDPAAFR